MDVQTSSEPEDDAGRAPTTQMVRFGMPLLSGAQIQKKRQPALKHLIASSPAVAIVAAASAHTADLMPTGNEMRRLNPVPGLRRTAHVPPLYRSHMPRRGKVSVYDEIDVLTMTVSLA